MNILETHRRFHEQIEAIEFAISEAYISPFKRHIDRLAVEHFVSKSLNKIQENSKQLVTWYNQKSQMDDLLSSITTNIEMTEFYANLRNIKELHKNNPTESVLPIKYEIERLKERTMNEDEIEKLFSGEEHHGRYLDVTIHHEQYLNIKNIQKIDYLTFLDSLKNLQIDKEQRCCSTYSKFIEDLIVYLEGFFERSKPLYPLESLKSKIKESFKPLESTYCQQCAKWFSNSVFTSHLSGKKHQKAASNTNNLDKDPLECSLEWKEHWMHQLIKELNSILEDTRDQVERRQSITVREREDDIKEDEEVDIEELDNIQSEKLYNPLKLPLGWDGKPIPYWLYKLHGLGKEYPCEICGNYIYMGRKAFDKHFQEWRHTYGMKCLGIPNTKQFQDIIQIQDAIALWKKIKSDVKDEVFRADTMEEFEDIEGNVFNRKTFEDLHRQGLL